MHNVKKRNLNFSGKLFFLVFARDRTHVHEKMVELKSLGVPYLIVCGEKLNNPNVIYREPKGKYDAINFGASFIPKDVNIVALNDVDTRVYGFDRMLHYLNDENVALVFARPYICEGPQRTFYKIMNAIRSRIPIASSGELMLIRREVLEEILPLRPCKAEDTYILFKVLERGYKAIFCQECIVKTERTKSAKGEEEYKRIKVTGIYQALSFTRPPLMIRLFYSLLPLISPLLLITGKKGYYWVKGILKGLLDYLRGDRSGFWQPTYMNE